MSVIKRLSYDEARHVPGYGASNNERYAIDWDNGERKYKRLMDCVYLYESGLLEVARPGKRDPNWRRELRYITGLDVCLLSEITNVRFINPLDGSVIKKSHIKQTDPVLYCQSLKRIYTSNYHYNNVGPCYTVYSEHAQPISNSQLRVEVPNKKKYQEALNSLKEHFALGDTLLALQQTKSVGFYPARALLKKLEVPTDLSDEKTQTFCMQISRNKAQTEAILKDVTADKIRLSYITVEEK